VNTYVVDAERVPLFYGHNMLQDWKAVFDIGRNEIKLKI